MSSPQDETGGRLIGVNSTIETAPTNFYQPGNTVNPGSPQNGVSRSPVPVGLEVNRTGNVADAGRVLLAEIDYLVRHLPSCSKVRKSLQLLAARTRRHIANPSSTRDPYTTVGSIFGAAEACGMGDSVAERIRAFEWYYQPSCASLALRVSPSVQEDTEASSPAPAEGEDGQALQCVNPPLAEMEEPGHNVVTGMGAWWDSLATGAKSFGVRASALAQQVCVEVELLVSLAGDEGCNKADEIALMAKATADDVIEFTEDVLDYVGGLAIVVYDEARMTCDQVSRWLWRKICVVRIRFHVAYWVFNDRVRRYQSSQRLHAPLPLGAGRESFNYWCQNELGLRHEVVKVPLSYVYDVYHYVRSTSAAPPPEGELPWFEASPAEDGEEEVAEDEGAPVERRVVPRIRDGMDENEWIPSCLVIFTDGFTGWLNKIGRFIITRPDYRLPAWHRWSLETGYQEPQAIPQPPGVMINVPVFEIPKLPLPLNYLSDSQLTSDRFERFDEDGRPIRANRGTPSDALIARALWVNDQEKEQYVAEHEVYNRTRRTATGQFDHLMPGDYPHGWNADFCSSGSFILDLGMWMATYQAADEMPCGFCNVNTFSFAEKLSWCPDCSKYAYETQKRQLHTAMTAYLSSAGESIPLPFTERVPYSEVVKAGLLQDAREVMLPAEPIVAEVAAHVRSVMAGRLPLDGVTEADVRSIHACVCKTLTSSMPKASRQHLNTIADFATERVVAKTISEAATRIVVVPSML